MSRDRRHLLDTNIVLYRLFRQYELTKYVSSILMNEDNIFYVSMVSVQELVMLVNSGKFKGKDKWQSAADILPTLDEMHYELLPVNRQHLEAYAELQPVANHGDPFDHIIIAQAIAERIPLISSDRKFIDYSRQKLTFIHNER